MAGETTDFTELETKIRKEEEQRRAWILKTRLQFVESLKERKVDRCRQLIFELDNLLKVDITKEVRDLEGLEEQLRQEKARNLKGDRIQAVRDSFNQALNERNTKRCKQAIQELRKLDVDHTKETSSLALLQQQIRTQEEAQIRQSMTHHVREKLAAALGEQDLKLARQHLKELKKLCKDTFSEEQAVNLLRQRFEEAEAIKLRRNMAAHLREDFQKALGASNVENARYYLKELMSLNVNAKSEKEALQGLEKRLKAEAELQERMIQQSRDEFQKGIAKRDLNHCEHYFRVLKELGAEVRDEAKALGRLRTEVRRKAGPNMSREEQEKLKQKMIEQFRFEFIRAFQDEKLEGCRYYLGELQQLKVDTTSEEEALTLLESKLSTRKVG